MSDEPISSYWSQDTIVPNYISLQRFHKYGHVITFKDKRDMLSLSSTQ